MSLLTITTSDTPTTLPDRVKPFLSSLPPLDKAEEGDIVALVFLFAPGRYDAILSPCVGALRLTQTTLVDTPWQDLSLSEQQALAPLAMAALATEDNQRSWMSTDIGDAWPDTDDAEGVEVCLFHHALTTNPKNMDDMLAYDGLACQIILSRIDSKSAHDSLVVKQALTSVHNTLTRLYHDHL